MSDDEMVIEVDEEEIRDTLPETVVFEHVDAGTKLVVNRTRYRRVEVDGDE